MKSKSISTLIKLVLCPVTECNGSEVCDICQYRHNGCYKSLRADVLSIARMLDGQVEETKTIDLEQRITEILRDIGMPAHIKGYRYTRKAIMLVVADPTVQDQITSVLYPAIAKEYDTTSSRVERAIRHAVEVAWDRGDIDNLQKYFGFSISNIKGKPTNSEFIAMIADKIRLELKY